MSAAGKIHNACRCWCGRRLSTLPGASGDYCAEHDHDAPYCACPSCAYDVHITAPPTREDNRS